jgi:hypothetical protein
MIKKIGGILLFAIILSQTGCVVSRPLIGARNPEYGNNSYKKILVWFSVQNVDDEMYSENSFIQYFKDANQPNNMMSQSDIKNHGLGPDFTNCKADFVAAHEVFFPGKNYTDQEIATGLKSNGFDALLLVHYYKGANDTTVTNGFISRGIFGSTDVNEVTTKLHQIRAELIDAKSSDTVWISDSAETQLDNDYTSSLANALVDNKLVEVTSSTPPVPFWKTH